MYSTPKEGRKFKVEVALPNGGRQSYDNVKTFSFSDGVARIEMENCIYLTTYPFMLTETAA